jgi:biopolymer transport protein ExbD
MKLSVNIKNISSLRNLLRPITRRLPWVMFVLIAIFLVVSMLQVNQILQKPTDQSYLDEQQKTSIRTRFDAQTIQRIQQLKSREDNASLDLPSSTRINPFNE